MGGQNGGVHSTQYTEHRTYTLAGDAGGPTLPDVLCMAGNDSQPDCFEGRRFAGSRFTV